MNSPAEICQAEGTFDGVLAILVILDPGKKQMFPILLRFDGILSGLGM